LSDYRGITLHVTHNIEEAYRTSENLLILAAGQVLAYGQREEIFNHPPNLTAAKLTGCKNFSRCNYVSAHLVEAVDWGCTLEVEQEVSSAVTFVGIRAHNLALSTNLQQANTFPAMLVSQSEAPFHIDLFFKLKAEQAPNPEHLLQAIMPKETWQRFRKLPAPLPLVLNRQHVFVMVK
jgi:ABC-type sulfate/molybdate transport systems ATPase subunit